MKFLEWKKADKKLSLTNMKEIASIFFLLIVSGGLCYKIALNFFSEVETIFLVSQPQFFIKEQATILLSFLLLPCLFLIFLSTLQRFLGFDIELTLVNAFKSAVVGLIVLLILSIPTNIVIEANLKSKGYIYCNWYTGASVRDPDVWLKNDELCLQDGSVITSDIYDWFEMHNEQGTEPTLNELESFIKKTRMELGR
ncbi:hypothetical protein PI2015_3018 [Pseudoalteromonas issachenkonii]|uniref:DUF1240 domain-containing protein n=3 Tax=Pseudoalteromonas TaxID=53246 RepID=A0ABM6N7C0_9GAMM|nr:MULTISPECIES: DUF1240 domain-containing protein [Pseudoalteromonas]ADT70015.1 hypothetical protein PSM_A3102 [Pseudoalteromonas sp. SM9913]ALQ56273.1 hypothetical protein PI2015_3018 [Pseudoalteromonas issachenkonii]ATC92184.1 hypothetical protein PISS_a3536 [Pseudoalteromonas issachenkonii]MDN3396154.1 DUF1240 domain-containing protein [Pseudoalteromonas sp. APC 3215]MDN3403194.1 DUF1240 domain-containing protein [Pseudoalteromonas sp. APC 3213]